MLFRSMIDGLEQSVKMDVPFLMDERTMRIDKLKAMMERPDVSVAEKFRKVMEAFQIENDYGSSSETYKQTLTLEDGASRDYNILRSSRIGLYFQSDDTRITGRWDSQAGPNGEGGWVEDNSARNEIRKGLRMAKQLIAPELINIPISDRKSTR